MFFMSVPAWRVSEPKANRLTAKVTIFCISVGFLMMKGCRAGG